MMIEHNNGGTSCSSDSSGSNMSSRCANNYIPDDLIIEVLSRLPDKTLVRFMCVSKFWRNWISISCPISGLLLWGISRDYPEIKGFPHVFIPLLPWGSNSNWLEALQSHCASLQTCDPEITVIDYCHGLFLLSNNVLWFGTSYYVCNPATNQCVALPEPPLSTPCQYLGSALLFDPHKSSHYKVLSSCRQKDFNEQYQLKVQIFSSDTNQWVGFSTYLRACINEPESDHFLDWHYPFIYLNGALHFFCNFGKCVISFYVEEKRLQEFELPDAAEHELLTRRLGESGGHMYYVACGHDKLQIWMLQSRDPHKWFKRHTLHFANFGKAISPSKYSAYFNIVAFHTNMEVLFINQGGVIFSYYFGFDRKDSDRLEEICTIGRNLDIHFASRYSRCLIPLKDACNRRSS